MSNLVALAAAALASGFVVKKLPPCGLMKAHTKRTKRLASLPVVAVYHGRRVNR